MIINIEIIETVIKILLHWIGLIGWSYCFLLLMEVVICKDVRLVNIERLLELSLKRRYKIFLRNLKSPYYTASVLLLIASIFALFTLSLELWYIDSITNKTFEWVLFHPIITFGIYRLYTSFGYSITYIHKVKLFFKNKEV